MADPTMGRTHYFNMSLLSLLYQPQARGICRITLLHFGKSYYARSYHRDVLAMSNILALALEIARILSKYFFNGVRRWATLTAQKLKKIQLGSEKAH